MKKLMIMLGAVAMSFGLFATEPVAYTNSFESAADGVQDGAFTPGEGWTWTTPATTIPVAQYTTKGETPYPYSPDERRFPDGAVQKNYLNLETGSDTLFRSVGDGNIFLDQLVKFTGFEEDPDFTEDTETKIAVWLKATESDDTATEPIVGETNLYVSVGSTTGKQDLVIASDIEPETWHRLTIKSLGDVSKTGTGRAGFLIYIDGQQVACDAAKSLFLPTDLSDDAAALQEKGLLFPAMIDNDATFASVGFKGIGGIDDVILDQEGPAFAQTVSFGVTVPANFTFTVVTNLTAGGPALVAQGGKYTAGNSDQIGILVEADGPVVMDPTWVTKTAAEGTIEVTLSDLEGKYEDAAVKLTREGETKPFYFTQEDFAALITKPKAVVGGDVIEVLQAIDKEEQYETVYSFTVGTTIAIEDVGNPITAVKWVVTVPDQETQRGTEAGELTFNKDIEPEKQIDVTFEGVNAEDGTFTYSGKINAGASLTVNNGVFEAGDIVLVDDAKVFTKDNTIKTIVDGEGNKIEAKAVPELDMYVYEIPAAPTTWEATIDLNVGTGVNAPTAKVNGAGDDVVIGEDGKVEVENGSTLVVTYTAETGYQFETDVATKSFTLTEENPSCGCPTATAIEYAITYYYQGDPLQNLTPTTYTVVSGANLPSEDVVKLPESMVFEGWYDNASFTGDAVTEIAIGSIGNTNFYAKAKPLVPEPERPSDITNPEQQAAYDNWVNTKAGFAKGHTESVYADYFAIDLTQEEVEKAGNNPEKAASDKLATMITADMINEIVAKGFENVDFTALETAYPNAKFSFVEATELTSMEGVSGFYRLHAAFKPANKD